MPRPRDVGIALLLLTASAHAEAPKTSGGLFDAGELGTNRKEPITITSDTLEYDYKSNVVVYRGEVVAIQGQVKLRSDTLTVTLTNEGHDTGVKPTAAALDTSAASGRQVRDIVAVGGVHIDNGTRWGTGGRATFDQSKRTVTLTENPVLHDGRNEVAGDRVVVYLDEDRSVVEGGRKRVKAVIYPGKDGDLAPGNDTPPTDKPESNAPAKRTGDETAKAATP